MESCRVWRTRRLSVAGRAGYGIFKSRGLVAVRWGPPGSLSRIFRGHWPAGWPAYPADSMSGSPRSRGAAIGAIRPPRGVMEPVPKSPCRPRQADALSRSGFEGPTGSSAPPQCNASCARRKRLEAASGGQASYDSKITLWLGLRRAPHMESIDSAAQKIRKNA
jgi:hypothetical protein